jgi:hypothetical protein
MLLLQCLTAMSRGICVCALQCTKPAASLAVVAAVAHQDAADTPPNALSDYSSSWRYVPCDQKGSKPLFLWPSVTLEKITLAPIRCCTDVKAECVIAKYQCSFHSIALCFYCNRYTDSNALTAA